MCVCVYIYKHYICIVCSFCIYRPVRFLSYFSVIISMQHTYKSCQNNTTHELRTHPVNCFSCFFFPFPSTSFRNPWASTVGIVKPSGQVPLWLILHLI